MSAKSKKKVVQVVISTFEPDPLYACEAIPDTLPPVLPQPIFRENKKYVYTGPEIHGIDVSHYQGHINWSEISKTDMANYVYVKASEGQNLLDDKYKTNIRDSRKHGLKVGSYHFFRPNATAMSQYQNFMSVVNVKHQDLIPLVDVETMNKNISVAVFHSRLLEFCRLVTKAFHGQKPMIYTGMNFYNKYFAGYPEFSQYKFMIASYLGEEPRLNNDDDYLIWQYTGHGSIRGIRGEVDQSKFRGGHYLQEIMLE